MVLVKSVRVSIAMLELIPGVPIFVPVMGLTKMRDAGQGQLLFAQVWLVRCSLVNKA